MGEVDRSEPVLRSTRAPTQSDPDFDFDQSPTEDPSQNDAS